MTARAASVSALRQHVRAERIELPGTCFERSLPRTVAFAGRPLAWLAGAFAIAGGGLPGWLAWPLAAAALLIAQRHLQTLVHDAAHGLYHRQGRINDRLANWLAAGWIGMTVENYRRIHFRHHAHNGSAEDPEHVSFATVAAAGGLLRLVLRYVCLLEALRLVRKYHGGRSVAGRAAADAETVRPQRPPAQAGSGPALPASGHLHIIGTQLLLGVACLALALPGLYVLWLYLAVTWSPLLSRLRFLVEHPGESDLTVTTSSSFWERLFFAPLNFNCHFEHHCWPAVPPYRLREAWRHLQQQGFYVRHPEYANQSFIGALVQRRQEHRLSGRATA
jgi:fatty acid desaturase